MENVMFDVSLSAGAYVDAPVLPQKEHQAVRRTADGSAWEIVDDYRGLTAYDTQTKYPFIIDFIGALPETFTLLKPTSEFDKWDGKNWVTDKEAMKNAQVDAARQKKQELSQEAENRIMQLERKIRLGMASEDEIALLKLWEVYTVKLDDINPGSAPEIEWPQKPE
ncbi:tail fiber assembly protein [Proteus mirabilis]|nr:tail fiber assembly protein [Proteus sp. G2658]